MGRKKNNNAIARRTGISRTLTSKVSAGQRTPIDIMTLFELPEIRAELKQHLKLEQVNYLLAEIERHPSPAYRDNLINALHSRYLLFSPTPRLSYPTSTSDSKRTSLSVIAT
jgi:hypothetical protein